MQFELSKEIGNSEFSIGINSVGFPFAALDGQQFFEIGEPTARKLKALLQICDDADETGIRGLFLEHWANHQELMFMSWSQELGL